MQLPLLLSGFPDTGNLTAINQNPDELAKAGACLDECETVALGWLETNGSVIKTCRISGEFWAD